MASLWTEKFFPSSLQEFLGNRELVDTALKWAEAWHNGTPGKPLLFVGQSGIGKTCLAYLIARHFEWQMFELNASDFRDKETIEKVVSGAALNASLFGERRLVLLDEIDCLSSQDRGGAAAILSVLRESKNPVILTANDVYADQKISGIRQFCTVLDFKKINYLSIAKRLRELLSKEKILFEEEAALELAKRCDGDFRSCLLDMQTVAFSGKVSLQEVSALSGREREENIFKVMSKIFFGKEPSEIRDAVFYSDVNQDMLFRWAEENIPHQFKGADVASAFDYLSRADIFNGRIFSRQYFGFMRYSTDLMAFGINQSRTQEYRSFTPFRFPSLLSKLSRSASARELKKRVAKKIGVKTHTSSRKVMVNDLPFYTQLLENKETALEFFRDFEFEADEIAFLLSAKPDSKKVEYFVNALAKPKPSQITETKVLQEKPSLSKKKKIKNEVEEQARQGKLF